MHNYIQELFIQNIQRSKAAHGGWLSFNGNCCVHNGQLKADTRKRCGVKFNASGGLQINCFNCSFTSGWTPGQLLSNKTKNFLTWMGVSKELIQKANFEALRIKENNLYDKTEVIEQFEFNYNRVNLPKGARKLTQWANDSTQPQEFINVLEYISHRNPNYLSWFDSFYWSPELPDRIIIPLLYDNNVYGWTARLARPEKIKNERKYLMNESQTKFIFGADRLFDEYRKYVIVTEGIFDAIAVSGIATLGNLLTENQIKWIKSSGKEVIVLPDKDQAGQQLIDAALQYGWSVSFPTLYKKGIKDAADCVNQYGRLMTIKRIIDSKQDNPTKIHILRQSWKE